MSKRNLAAIFLFALSLTALLFPVTAGPGATGVEGTWSIIGDIFFSDMGKGVRLARSSGVGPLGINGTCSYNATATFVDTNATHFTGTFDGMFSGDGCGGTDSIQSGISGRVGDVVPLGPGDDLVAFYLSPLINSGTLFHYGTLTTPAMSLDRNKAQGSAQTSAIRGCVVALIGLDGGSLPFGASPAGDEELPEECLLVGEASSAPAGTGGDIIGLGSFVATRTGDIMAPVSAPMLSEWVLVGLAGLLALGGMVILRRV